MNSGASRSPKTIESLSMRQAVSEPFPAGCPRIPGQGLQGRAGPATPFLVLLGWGCHIEHKTGSIVKQCNCIIVLQTEASTRASSIGSVAGGRHGCRPTISTSATFIRGSLGSAPAPIGFAASRVRRAGSSCGSLVALHHEPSLVLGGPHEEVDWSIRSCCCSQSGATVGVDVYPCFSDDTGATLGALTMSSGSTSSACSGGRRRAIRRSRMARAAGALFGAGFRHQEELTDAAEGAVVIRRGDRDRRRIRLIRPVPRPPFHRSRYHTAGPGSDGDRPGAAARRTWR